MARIGIIGYPNSGKTALFNAVTGLSAPSAPHPFSTTEPNVGVARVPDAKLDEVARLEQSAKTVYAQLELLDLPLEPGGKGLSAKLLGRLREMEALAAVVRGFEDDAVPSDGALGDPADQAGEILLELALADADVLGRRAERTAKEATGDQGLKRAAAAYARAAAVVEDGRQMRSERWTHEELGFFSDIAPLTLKPMVWVVNVDEDTADLRADAEAVASVVPDGDTVVWLSARLEEEAAQLDVADRVELFEGLGMGEGALATLVRAVYDAIGLISFYTVGPKESHAWTVERGASARRAAGKIHSDLERGFIRAEIAPLDVVIAAAGWDAAKASGQVRLEGKDYVMQNGDVMVVRFSV